MSREAPPPPDPTVWQAQYLRLIAFPVQPAFDYSRGWWRDLTGADPQTSTEKRQRQEREDSGPYAGIELSLAVDLLRVQWTAALALDLANPPSGVPSIGPFLARRDWFRDLMAPWLNALDRPIKRLAFAGALVTPVDDRRSAYERLNQYLRWVDIDPGSSDFLYRINRPRPSNSGVTGLTINRLTTWGAMVFTLQRGVLIMGDPAIHHHDRGPELFATLAELDINTSADRQEGLPRERLGQIFTELTDVALDIASHGDSRP
jgi:hypothetical protein